MKKTVLSALLLLGMALAGPGGSSAGEPAADVLVKVFDLGASTSKPVTTIKTGKDGGCVLKGLKPGSYKFETYVDLGITLAFFDNKGKKPIDVRIDCVRIMEDMGSLKVKNLDPEAPENKAPARHHANAATVFREAGKMSAEQLKERIASLEKEKAGANEEDVRLYDREIAVYKRQLERLSR